MIEAAGTARRVAVGSAAASRRLMRAPLSVASARLRAHPGRALLVALGVGASTAILAACFGASLIARDRAVQRALADLPPSERLFRVDAYGLPVDTTYPQADRQVRALLSPLGTATPLRGVFFRELRIQGELVQLAGLEGLPQLVQLRSGRLPRTCAPARCEVLEIGGAAIARLDEAGIHLVRVGVADVPGRAVFGASIDTERQGGDNPTLLLASGAHAFDGLPAFDGLFRIYSWIAPLDPHATHLWDVGRVLEHETRTQTALVRAGDEYQFSGPDQALIDARSEGEVAAQRMLLIGGEASTVLLGFALITAMGLRRGLSNERRRLLQRGARRAQVWLASGAEVAATTVAGTVAGIGVGVACVALAANAAGLPIGALLAHALATWECVGALVALWVVSTLTVLAGARARDEETRRRRVGALDVAALGAAAAVALALARGGLDVQALTSGGNRWLLLLLPLLVSFVAAVIAVRLLGPAMRFGERAARRGAISLRLALLALSRAPARTTTTAAFLLVSLGLGLFAASWRATLDRGAGDQAAFAVPMDFTVVEGSRLVLPFEAAPLARYESIAPGVDAYPVLRRSADVAGVGTSVLSPTVLGLPPAAVAGLHWRSDFANEGPRELARRIAEGGPVVPTAISLPSDTRSVFFDVTLRGVPVRLDLVVRDVHGATSIVFLGERAAGSWRVSATLRQTVRQVVGLEISLASAEQLGVNHRETGAEEASAAAGTARVGPLRAIRADGSVGTVTRWNGLLARRGLRVDEGTRPRLSYAFTEGQTMVLRVRQPTDGRPLPVLVSPDVARSADRGELVLDFQGVRLPARIVAVARRFPASEQQGEGFVVADESRLATALDADQPGTATPGEIWLSAARGTNERVAAALARPPFEPLAVSSRLALQHSLASDPLARGISLSLAAAALAALVLAVTGFWVAILSELRDERGELFDLEAQGVDPATLMRQMRLRAAILVALGVAGGCLLGVALSRLVVAVIQVSGTTEPAEPPLRLDLALPLVLVGLAAVVAALVIVVEVTTRSAFRADTPERASWSLE